MIDDRSVEDRGAQGERMSVLGRRALLAAGAGLALAPWGAVARAPNVRADFVYVGCRTTRERNARGEGISVYRSGGGKWSLVQRLQGLPNPSYLAADRDARFLFAGHGDGSEISSFAIDPSTGALTATGTRSSLGKNVVHVCVDPSNRFLLATNHLTIDGFVSNVAVFPITPDGRIGEAVDVAELRGTPGPHRREQPFAKPHQAVFHPGGGWIAVPDKGLDRVHTFWLDGTGKLRPTAPAMVARPGAGPRHMRFHPRLPFAYLLNEIDSTLLALRVDGRAGTLVPFQFASLLRDDFIGPNHASDILISRDGRSLFATNRGMNTVVRFAIDVRTGRIDRPLWQSSGGAVPRQFAFDLDGDDLLVGNETGHNIVRIPISGGRLGTPQILVETGSPTCILPLRVGRG